MLKKVRGKRQGVLEERGCLRVPRFLLARAKLNLPFFLLFCFQIAIHFLPSHPQPKKRCAIKSAFAVNLVRIALFTPDAKTLAKFPHNVPNFLNKNNLLCG